MQNYRRNTSSIFTARRNPPKTRARCASKSSTSTHTDLRDEPKTGAALTLQRLAHSAFEKSIPKEAINEISAPNEPFETTVTNEIDKAIDAAMTHYQL